MAKKKFWNFIKNQATETTPENIELRICGEIMSDDDAWIYEWFEIPCASPNSFRNELAKYKSMDITVWIDSYGGDVFAGAGIYNALKEHDGKVTVKIDGKAMSAASVIAMAGDEILMSPVGIMMIHNPLTYAQGDMRAMRKAADVLDTVKETIINAYVAKTGRTEEEISSMMDDETWMSANVAVKEGFADNVLYFTEDKTEPQNVMNFAYNRLSIQNSLNESIKHFLTFEKNKLKNSQECQCNSCDQTAENCKCSECGKCSCCDNPSCCGCDCQMSNECSKSTMSNCKNKTLNKGGKDMIFKNVEDFKNQLPDLHKEVYNSGNVDGVKAERERLKAFDVLNGKVDAAFLNEEKYKDGATAESVLFKAMQEEKVINNSYVSQAVIDAASANKVPGATSDNTNPDEVTGILNLVENVAKKTLGNGGK
jgi:ATP-dependent Clp protease, protease subunit